MNDLLEFLTSEEIRVVYIIALGSCLLCFIIYLVERNNIKARQRHNTKELNKLVEEVQEEMPQEEPTVMYEEPILETIKEDTVEMLEEDNKLEYTSIEPDQETARLELERLKEELQRQVELLEEEPIIEELEENVQEPVIQNVEPVVEEVKIQDDNNISLTMFEEQQEQEAIISLEEWLKKSKTMYDANELTQYADEGNVPISLQELERQVGKNSEALTDTFKIENVVSNEEVLEEVKPEAKTIKMDDFNTISEVKKFKSSPIISPIYGIERPNDNDLELENTANYEKLDAEIKKTNEFIVTLKELQGKLD